MARFSPERPLLPEILALHARWLGDAPALIAGGRTVGWRPFHAAVTRAAAALAADGIRPGDRVAVVMSNGRPMVEALFAIMTAGACSVPINLSVSDESLAGMLADSGARAVIATDDQVARLAGVGLALRYCSGDAPEGWTAWEGRCAEGGDPAALPRRLDPNGPCNIIYSSGTTGTPKGILHTHAGRLDWAYDTALAFRYHRHSRSLCTIGLYSNIMWVQMLCTFLCGGTLIVHRRFEPEATLAAIRREGVTHIAMVPVQYQRLLDAEAGADDLVPLEVAITVGSKMPVPLKKRFAALVPGRLYELYGLTEGIITVQEPDEAAAAPESVGRPIVGCDIQVIDEADRPVPTGGAGEIVSRARYVMPGYWNRPDETERSQWCDDEGRAWLRTGDIGVMDAAGRLTIVDRKKDMILSGGQNIYPADLEAVLLEHPAVREAAVFAVPHDTWGETPMAAVVAGTGAPDEVTLKDWANARLGKQQRLNRLVYVDVLPRNANGKVLKRTLRTTYG